VRKSSSNVANNSTFSQPIDKIAHEISQLNVERKSSGLFPILVHTDAAQTIGKVSVDVQEVQVDYLTIVGHKVIHIDLVN
jgi:selenocysteine lyase